MRRLKRSKRKSLSFLEHRSEAQLPREVGSEPLRDRRTPRVAPDRELLPLSEKVRTATPPPAARRDRDRARAAACLHGRRRRLNRLSKSSGNVSVNANANCSTGSKEQRSDRARPDFEVRPHRTSTRRRSSRLPTGSRARKIRSAPREGRRRVLRTAMLRLRLRRRRVTSGGVPKSVRSARIAAPTAPVGSTRRCHRRRSPFQPPRRRKRFRRPRHRRHRPHCLFFRTAINGRRPSDRR